MMGLDDLKAKINKFYPKKIIIDTIRGNVFLYIYIYISFEFDYKSSSCFTVFFFFFLISRSPSSRYSFSFILSSFFHLHPLRVD